MKEIQTPRNKEITHRRRKDSPSSKSISDQSKNLQKVIAKKSLNFELASISEESLNQSVTDSPNFSASSLVSSDNNLISEPSDSSESSLSSENQSTITSDETSRLFNVTPFSTVTSINDESVNLLVGRRKEIGSNGSIEVDVILNLLKQARNQVSSSNDVSASSKKYLDALVETYMRDLCALPDEEDAIDVLLSKRLRVVVICFVVWLIAMTMIMIRWSGTRRSLSFSASPT